MVSGKQERERTMGTATKEWERNHGKAAREDARKRAEQRLAEVNEKKEKAIARSAQVAQDFVRETYFEELKLIAYATVKQRYADMKDAIESYTQDVQMKKRPGVSKRTIVSFADMLCGAIFVFVETFGKSRDVQYMWNQANNALEAYK